MSRTKGSKNKPKGNGPDVETTTHNNEPLSDEQYLFLTQKHVELYEASLAKKKTSDANFKNVCKVAKADGIKLADIKAYIDAGTDEGQEKLAADAERLARVARWRNFDLGIFEQAELFGDEDAPQQTRSFTLGREAGMAGEPAKVSPGCDVNEFMAGWQIGNAALGEKTFKQKAADAEEFN